MTRDRAKALLPPALQAATAGSGTAPVWLSGADELLRRDGAGEWVRLDAQGNARVLPPLPDGAGQPVALPDGGLAVVHDGRLLRLEGGGWVDDGPAPGPGDVPSPDHGWLASLDGADLVLRERRTGAVRRVTRDGTPDQPYATPPDLSAFPVAQRASGLPRRPVVAWSPDGTKLLSHRIDQSRVRRVHLVAAGAQGEGPGDLLTLRYPVPGDAERPVAELLVVDVATGAVTPLRHEPYTFQHLSAVASGQAWWGADGQVWFVVTDAPSRQVSLRRADPDTGDVVEVLAESNDTQVQTGPHFTDNLTRVLSDGRVLWWSERDGWGHLYLYDGRGCSQLTSGPWQVRGVVAVDETGGRVLFTGGGREAGLDPYLRQLYSVPLDGGEVTRLTDDDLDHEVTVSPTGMLLLDEPARWDTGARWVLRDLDGSQVADLGRVDLDPLREAGWRPPQRITGLAADGTTPLYGLMHLPADLRDDGSHPVLVSIYPGPQAGISNVRSPGATGWMRDFGPADAALGFAVLSLDGRGTPLRSKAFHEHTRRHGPEYLDDHASVLHELAASRPWMDLARVGIWGASAGGYGSTRALIERPDVFTVAVSVCGNHDDRLYHAGWTERFFGLEGEFDPEKRSNIAQAHRLEGRLLLVHGDLDDNVLPAHSLQLFDALLAHGKDADLLIVPNADHGMAARFEEWFSRRWDFLLRHLARQEPDA